MLLPLLLLSLPPVPAAITTEELQTLSGARNNVELLHAAAAGCRSAGRRPRSNRASLPFSEKTTSSNIH